MSGVIGEIKTRLNDALAPTSITLVDQSHRHIGHAGATSGAGHFELEIVSDRFSGLTPLQRHRLVYDALQALIPDKIHALEIKTLVPGEV